MKNSIFLKLLAFYKLLLRHNLHTYVPRSVTDRIIQSRFGNKIYDVDGHHMYLNEGLFSLSLGEPFEPMETHIVKSFVKSGDTAVDLGANIGYYTLLLARQVGRDGKVVAFEPSPTNFKILEKNVKKNGYSNVELNQLAAADKSGKAKLQLTPNPADSRIRSKGYEMDRARDKISDKSVDIQTISLDDYFRERDDDEIDFIKIDIQGAEFLAFQGMQRILSRSKNIQILTEFFPKLLKESGTEPSNYLKMLQQAGFYIYSIDEKNSKLIQTNSTDLLGKYPDETHMYTNLLLTKENMDYTAKDLNI